ncbi:hypothetical protein FACS189418_0830 [Clostridia bacterium]|nr:hypothetical protein FACS189418_0830 [Clostridia bacterium]
MEKIKELKELLKQNEVLRKLVKKKKNTAEFLQDAKEFNTYYLEEGKSENVLEYQMLLLVHSLEKGMCMKELRPFGGEKCQELIRLINRYEQLSKTEESSAYQMAFSILNKWRLFYEEHHWQKDAYYALVNKFLKKQENHSQLAVGFKEISKEELTKGMQIPFSRFCASRHSVRKFSSTPISEEVLWDCVKTALTAPSACNRQMCKVYAVKKKEHRQFLNKMVIGVNGFEKEYMQYFLITFDLSSFNFYGERNQGFFNAGLFAMTFAFALHEQGIGSCFLQWSNTAAQSQETKRRLSIPLREKIVVAIGAGYYAEHNQIPCSYRKKVEEVLRVL